MNIAGAALELLPERGILWAEENALLVADVHLGKEHVFGRSGIAIPAGSTENTLARLSKLLVSTRATECIVLGDFFHDTPLLSDSWLVQLSDFLDEHETVSLSVVAGNHDKENGQPRLDKRIAWHKDPIHRGPFVLQHEPGIDKRGHVLAGHIHPVATLRKKAQRSITGPCFWQQKHCTILPAFGDFTGGFSISPSPKDSIYLSGDSCVIPIPVAALSFKRQRALNF